LAAPLNASLHPWSTRCLMVPSAFALAFLIWPPRLAPSSPHDSLLLRLCANAKPTFLCRTLPRALKSRPSMLVTTTTSCLAPSFLFFASPSLFRERPLSTFLCPCVSVEWVFVLVSAPGLLATGARLSQPYVMFFSSLHLIHRLLCPRRLCPLRPTLALSPYLPRSFPRHLRLLWPSCWVTLCRLPSRALPLSPTRLLMCLLLNFRGSALLAGPPFVVSLRCLAPVTPKTLMLSSLSRVTVLRWCLFPPPSLRPLWVIPVHPSPGLDPRWRPSLTR